MNNLKGKKFGRLTVLSKGEGKSFWKCECKCGNIVTVRSDNLRSGRSQSCGCLRKRSRTGNVLIVERDEDEIPTVLQMDGRKYRLVN